MKIGVIGAGRIGSTVGGAWAKAGHDVMFGLRDAGRAGDLPGSTGTFAEAAAHGDVVFFAIPGGAMMETVQQLDLAGKILIDATNGGGSPDKPLVNMLAAALPQTSIYKAFNTLGYENFADPIIGGEQADLLFIGPDEHLATVIVLIADTGINPVHVGGLDQMGVLDAAMMFWFQMTRRFGRHTAFRVLHDKG